MGNLCGKVDKTDDAFSGAGRTLGGAGGGGARPIAATGPQPKTAPVPARAAAARTLGGGQPGAGASSSDARARAAEAAQARHGTKTGTTRTAKKPGAEAVAGPSGPSQTKPSPGKLAAKLEAQKRMTDNDVLVQASRDEVRWREIDRNKETTQ